MANPSIPAGPDEITAQWLSTVLGTPVDDVTVSPIGTGQTGATYRVVPTYGSGGGELPETFVVKLPSQDAEVRARASFGYQAEHAFYTEVADTVRVPMPRCYHCDIDSGGTDFVLLLSDMAPAVQGDQIAGCGVQEAELAVRALAGLHGPRWCDPAWRDFAGAAMGKPDEDSAKGLGDIFTMAVGMTLEKLGSRLSQEDAATLNDVATVMTPWLLLEPDRFSVLHGDFRLDNLLFDPDHTRISVVDWQTLAVGLPARDLAYFIASGLEPQLRARTERDLVDAYHRELLAHGVRDYDAETCWRDYKLGLLQVPLITALAVAFVQSTERGDDVMVAMIERSCRAIRDLDTLQLVRELSAAS
ncbi:MAG TPA: phosphotransferase [Mycobacterium sp.]|nr:phosphotransferase [Mycobacterium sp.]